MYSIGKRAGIFAALILGGCVTKGPLRMDTISVNNWVDRVENKEIVCYLVGEHVTCKWKTEPKLDSLEDLRRTYDLPELPEYEGRGETFSAEREKGGYY